MVDELKEAADDTFPTPDCFAPQRRRCAREAAAFNRYRKRCVTQVYPLQNLHANGMRKTPHAKVIIPSGGEGRQKGIRKKGSKGRRDCALKKQKKNNRLLAAEKFQSAPDWFRGTHAIRGLLSLCVSLHRRDK